jgi:hypothetical protein
VIHEKKVGCSRLAGNGGLLGIVFDLYVGYYNSYIDHDEHRVYFIKKTPALRGEFINPFANEGDASAVDDLPSDVRQELSDYCKYAYGIIHGDSKSLEGCRVQILRDVQ